MSTAQGHRRLRRDLARAIPASRRVKGLGGAKGRRWLQARKLVAPLLQRPVTLTTARGLRLRVTADPVDEHIAQHLLGPRRDDYFPPWPPGAPSPSCVLDIGAHHGLYAAAALHEYPGSRVVCVEPSAAAQPDLRANLARNGFLDRARVVHGALAASRGEGVLQHTEDGTWGFSLYEDAASAVGSETVPLLTLADILGADRPDVVKSNAEGAEFCLLDQLAATDLRPRLLIVMVHPQFGDMDALVAQAERLGYDVTPLGIPSRPAFHMWQR
jgi:FkbM family methyltransferase